MYYSPYGEVNFQSEGSKQAVCEECDGQNNLKPMKLSEWELSEWVYYEKNVCDRIT